MNTYRMTYTIEIDADTLDEAEEIYSDLGPELGDGPIWCADTSELVLVETATPTRSAEN